MRVGTPSVTKNAIDDLKAEWDGERQLKRSIGLDQHFKGSEGATCGHLLNQVERPRGSEETKECAM